MGVVGVMGKSKDGSNNCNTDTGFRRSKSGLP